ncbi:branched-chain amino acid ABC transporter permease [Microlunatus soli]|uniref:Amino acid/amide ABC transporter membrane protein 1, HAAT family n=1 Tax=Microlunatus soli TaxID=630515 RepID=A0A1H1PE09_9ACTN|nr:branched-chain amino acid ABC transporter permease [Microlunatus soli]SDS09245.1 amino acid/amide ABC transporter membrane protein 1, HAAT family [Microlunatus soli]
MLVLQALIDGLSLGALYALIAVGYTVVYGIIQLINFAHGEIFMVGAFGAVTVWLLVPGGVLSFWMLPLMLIGGIIASVAVALLMERAAYRPLRNAPRLAPLITAIGVSVFLQEFVRLFYNRIPGFPDAKANVAFPRIQGVTGEVIRFGGLQLDRPSIFTLLALIICTVFLYFFINKSNLGRAMQATSQDPDTARLMGINVDRIIMIAFAVGAALAAVAGVAQGLKDTNINFRMGFLAGLKAFSAAVLGGIGNIWGALVGGLVIGLLESLATAVMPSGSAWKDVWAFVVLILILVFRPQGLLGARVVDRA